MSDKQETNDAGRTGGLAVAPCSASLDSRLRDLHAAVEDLMQIVEGFRGERWAANGRRLVDTPEWCRLYVVRCAVNRYGPNVQAEPRGP